MNIIIATMCTPFLRGFVPGILIGVFTSVLLIWLWRTPILLTQRSGEPEFGGELPRVYTGAAGRAVTVNKTGDCGMQYLQTWDVVGSYLLLILIHSTPAGDELRRAIRSTWLQDHTVQGEYVAKFVIGTKGLEQATLAQLACENKKHQDLLLLSGIRDELEWPDSEKLLSSFSWSVKNVEFSFIFKCNDATFAVLNTITRFLQSRRTATSLIWGFFAGGVQAAKVGNLGEKDWYLCNSYLPYPQGGGYIISQDLVTMLVTMADDLEQYTHDDIAVGVWLSPFDGIQKKHDVRFNSGYYSRGCNNAYIVLHRQTPQSMVERFGVLKRTGFLCEEEFQSRLSYVFNWTAQADRCCIRKPGIP